MKKTKLFIRISVITLILAQSVFFAPYASADAWGSNAMAAILKQTMEKIARQIEGAILGALKASAIQLLNTQVGNLIGGSTAGNSRIIADWGAFMYEEPEKKVAVYMEDFFTSATKGRASSASYTGQYSLSTADPLTKSYSTYLVDTAKMSLSSPYQPSSLEDISPDPIQSLEEGDLRTLNAYFTNPMNNPFGFSLAAQSYEQAVREREQQIAMVEAIAGDGYKSVKDSNGNTVLPGSTVGQIVADAQDIGNKVIAGATNPAELASGVVTALVNKTITGMIQKGVGDVQANLQKEIGSVDQKISNQLNSINSVLGPAAQFSTGLQQQLNVDTKPASDPGAAIPKGTWL